PARAGEPASGTAPMNFRAHLTRSSTEEIRFNYITQDLEAVGGLDFVTTSGVATFAPGQVELTITVPILADAIAEAPERFRVQFSNAVQANLAQTVVLGTIEDPSYRAVLEFEDEEIGGPATIPT